MKQEKHTTPQDIFAELASLKARTDLKLAALEAEREAILREHEAGVRGGGPRGDEAVGGDGVSEPEGKLAWRLGSFSIAMPGGKVGVTGLACVEAPFTIHKWPGNGLWTLTFLPLGEAIIRDRRNLLDLLRFAERIAGLDWSGTRGDIRARNTTEVLALWSEVTS